MNNEYIIINKTAIERIDELIKEANVGKTISSINSQMADSLIRFKEQLLSQSTPLIPEIEKAFDESRRQHSWAGGNLYGDGYDEEEDLTDFKYKSSQDYISNLKLDI